MTPTTTRRATVGRALALVGSLAVLTALAVLVPCRPRADTPTPPAVGTDPANASTTWPRFRGPDGSGITPFDNLPLTWDAATGEGVIWRTALPLPGSGSAIIWGDRLFVTGADESRREVYCLDAHTGEMLWTAPVAEGYAGEPRTHRMTGFAAPTAATDGERVYAVFPTGHVAALDFAGTQLWQRHFDMAEDIYGHASSLLIWGELLIVQVDLGKPDVGLSHMAALDRATGEVVWDIPRPVQGSWTTPIIIDTGERVELVTSAKPWVIAYDPATGEEFWRVRCVDGDSGPSPIYANGHIYVANIYASLVAIRPGGAGDVTDTHVSWSARGSLPDICSPLCDGELVFVMATGGMFSCFDADDGALVWSEALGRRFRSSPSLVGSRVYLIGESGECLVVAAAREYEELGSGRLGEAVHSSPSFAHGRMYLRGERHLFCVAAP